MNEGEDDVVYNDVMNVEEFLEEHNIRYNLYQASKYGLTELFCH